MFRHLGKKTNCIFSAAATAKSSHCSNRCRQGAGQCSGQENGETSCWCFQQANASPPGLKASRHLVSDAVSSRTWLCLHMRSLEMMQKYIIYHIIISLMHQQIYQIPAAWMSCATECSIISSSNICGCRSIWPSLQPSDPFECSSGNFKGLYGSFFAWASGVRSGVISLSSTNTHLVAVTKQVLLKGTLVGCKVN